MTEDKTPNNSKAFIEELLERLEYYKGDKIEADQVTNWINTNRNKWE